MFSKQNIEARRREISDKHLYDYLMEVFTKNEELILDTLIKKSSVTERDVHVFYRDEFDNSDCNAVSKALSNKLENKVRVNIYKEIYYGGEDSEEVSYVMFTIGG